MELQTFYWLAGGIVAAISIYNFVVTVGHKQGSADAHLGHSATFEQNWNVKFDSLHNALSLHQVQTTERFERMLERLNEALLTMAREHPTKNDLQMVKAEILDRIDSSAAATRRRAGKATT